MKTHLSRLAAVLAAGTLVSSSAAQDVRDLRAEVAHLRSNALLEADPTLQYDPTTLLVRFRAGQLEPEREALRQTVGGGRLRSFETVPGLELIHVAMPVSTAIDTLEPYVEYAEPNWVVHAFQTPDDEFFDLQWGLHNTGQDIRGVTGVADADIDGPEAWNTSTGDPGFAVAIIDTGTQYSHPDLSANIWTNPDEIADNGVDDDGNGYVDDVVGWDFFNGDNDPDDPDGHGTHTAGTVGAVGNNGIGVAGVNWQCQLVPLRFIGPFGGSISDAILAVEYCTTEGIQVSNNSWGGGGFSQSMYDAIQASKTVGHVFCAAAGNSGEDTDSTPHYPSSYDLDNIISVAATDNQDQMASFSNFGSTSVDLGAPGVDIASTYNGSNYAWASGTSMACPHVAGVAALVYANDSTLGYSGVVNAILSTTRPTSAMSGNTVTGGVLNANDALGGDGGGGGDTTPPAAPTGLAATAGDAVVDLDWDDNTESDLDGYNVYRSTTSGGPYDLLASLVASSAYSDGSVTNGTTYYYVVTALDTTGNESAVSAEVSATPQSSGGGDATDVHVASILADTVNLGKGVKQGRATVVIEDDLGSPFSGANVTVTFTGDGSGTKTGTTGSDGSVTLLSDNTPKGRFKFTVCVDDVTTSTLPYDQNDNVQTCASN